MYAWTVPVGDAFRVFYVGQTEAGFAARHHDHFHTYFTGAYSIYDPKAFLEGRLDKLYHGFGYRKPSCTHAIEFYRNAPALIPQLTEHLDAMRFFIAPLPQIRRLQRRVETALMQQIYSLTGPEGQLLEKGLKLEPRFLQEEPIAVRQVPAGLLEGVPEYFSA